MSAFKFRSAFVLLSIVVSIDFSLQQQRHAKPSMPVSYECEPITMHYCSQLGYNSTVMPNILNHKTQTEAASELYQFYPLFLGNCDPNLQFFVCSIYIPMCNNLNGPVPPCRSVCLAVKKGCKATMKQAGFDWPEVFDCSEFPVSTAANGVQCLDGYQQMNAISEGYDGTLLYSNLKHIDSLSVYGGKISKSKVPLISSGVYIKHAAGLAVDYESGRVIYGDQKKGTINSVFFNASHHFVLARDQGEVNRMDFDPVKRVLYWVYQNTLVRHGAIKYMKVTEEGTSGSNVRTLLDLPLLAYVTGIAVDKCGQNIFWAKVSGLHGTAILKTHLEYVSTQTIISSEIWRPSALTIDHEAMQLYWSDKWLHKIERCDFDGRHRVIIAEGDSAATVYGMAIFGDYLYWSECNKKSLNRANKESGGDLVIIENHLQAPEDVVVIMNNTNECVHTGYENFV